jgi:DNA adenine methylase
MGSNTEYVEPFLGGGAILLKFLQSQMQIKRLRLNDKDVALACLWTAVIRYKDELIKRTHAAQPSTHIFYRIKEELSQTLEYPTQEEDILSLGFKKLLIHQISYSGLGVKSGGPLGGSDQASPYKIDCRWRPDNIAKKITKINHTLSRYDIAGCCCTSCDFSEVIHDNALIYLDPPYYHKGNELYKHGFAHEDHQGLAACLRAIRADWVLSYDDCPQIMELYDWAEMSRLSIKYTITSNKNKWGRTELLIVPRS